MTELSEQKPRVINNCLKEVVVDETASVPDEGEVVESKQPCSSQASRRGWRKKILVRQSMVDGKCGTECAQTDCFFNSGTFLRQRNKVPRLSDRFFRALGKH